jgi:hypothetical protein
MAQNKLIRTGPVALTTTLTTNILNPNATSGGVGMGTPGLYIILRRIRIVNKTVSAATFSLWIGATGANAAGTEFLGTTLSVAANSAFDWSGNVRLDVADFLVGGAGTTTALTFEAEGEVGVA